MNKFIDKEILDNSGNYKIVWAKAAFGSNYLSFTFFEKKNGQWMKAENGYACTQNTIETSEELLVKMGGVILRRLSKLAENGFDIKKEVKRLSWIYTDWYEEFE
jgi:hypothetical protein